MRVLICGGTGFLGKYIVSALTQLGHDPVVRSRHTSPALDFGKCITPESWLEHLQGIGAVINAVQRRGHFVIRQTHRPPQSPPH